MPLSFLSGSLMAKVNRMEKTACDRLDSLFMLVEAIVRDLLPSTIRSSISWADTTRSWERPSTYGPRMLCSRTFREKKRPEAKFLICYREKITD
jgi:hypothetical protein